MWTGSRGCTWTIITSTKTAAGHAKSLQTDPPDRHGRRFPLPDPAGRRGEHDRLRDRVSQALRRPYELLAGGDRHPRRVSEQGIRRQFLREIEQHARAHGAKLIELASVNDEPHMHFYTTSGMYPASNLKIMGKQL